MARHKPAGDPRGAHLRLYWDVVDSLAWRCLSATDRVAYIALQRQLKSFNNGDLSLPLSYARTHGIKSPATLAKALRALCAVGLIAITRQGGCTRGGQRLPSLYRLTDHQAYEMPAKGLEAYKPSNEWKDIETLAQGRRLICEAEARAAEKAATKKKSLLQSLIVTTSKNEVVEALTASNNEAWTSRPLQKVKQVKAPINGSKAHNGAVSDKPNENPDSQIHTSNIEALYILPGMSDSGGGGRRKFIVAGSGKHKSPDGLEAVMTP